MRRIEPDYSPKSFLRSYFSTTCTAPVVRFHRIVRGGVGGRGGGTSPPCLQERKSYDKESEDRIQNSKYTMPQARGNGHKKIFFGSTIKIGGFKPRLSILSHRNHSGFCPILNSSSVNVRVFRLRLQFPPWRLPPLPQILRFPPRRRSRLLRLRRSRLLVLQA